MVALVDVALNHDAHDCGLTSFDLLSENTSNLGLVLVVLFRVAMTAVNHQARIQALRLELLARLLQALSVVVGALLSTAQDDEAVIIADSADDGHNTGLGDGEEVVRMLDRANRIDCDIESAVGTVLEANRERQTRGKLTVELRLGGPCAYSSHTQHVSEELRRDSVEHFASKWHALLGQVNEELTRDAQTLVDLEGVVDIWVVDETLPANCRARLLQVGAHDNKQIILVLLLEHHQTIAVLERGLGVVNRARANDDEQPALGVFALDNGDSFIAGLDDSLSRLCRLWDLALQKVGRGEGIVASNAPVLRVVRVADGGVFDVELEGKRQ